MHLYNNFKNWKCKKFVWHWMSPAGFLYFSHCNSSQGLSSGRVAWQWPCRRLAGFYLQWSWKKKNKLTWKSTLQIDPGSRRRWRWRSFSRRSSSPSSTSCRRTTERMEFSQRCVLLLFIRVKPEPKDIQKNDVFTRLCFSYIFALHLMYLVLWTSAVLLVTASWSQEEACIVVVIKEIILSDHSGKQDLVYLQCQENLQKYKWLSKYA